MKQFLVLVAVLVPLSLFVAGCGVGGGGGSPAAKKAAQESEANTKAMMQKPGGLKGAATPGK